MVCENFQAGTLEKWGIGWDELRAVNPKIILLRISGYGQNGPYANRPCFGRIANAFGGISFLSGEADRPPAQPGSATLSDYMAGCSVPTRCSWRFAPANGTARASDRRRSLRRHLPHPPTRSPPPYQKGGYVRRRDGAETPIVVPHSHFPTSDDRWIAIACTNDRISSAASPR